MTTTYLNLARTGGGADVAAPQRTLELVKAKSPTFKLAHQQVKKMGLSKVPRILQLADKPGELRRIWRLRNAEYGKRYMGFSDSRSDNFDQSSCVLFSQAKAGDVLSTGRVVIDSPLGLPADEYIKPFIDKLRSKGLVLAEPSKFAISRRAGNILPLYLLTIYEIGMSLGIDSLIFIIWDKNVGLYKRIVDAKVLVPDIGFSYGTNNRFSLLECKIQKQLPPYFKSLQDK